MEINTTSGLINLNNQTKKDGNITVNDLKEIDTDNNGTISEAEATAKNISGSDLQEINQAYSTHNSDPTKVVFSKDVLEAKKQQTFVEKNFAKIDQDKDGFLSKGELTNAKNSNDFSAEEKSVIVNLIDGIEDLEEYSNDEWFDENDGITKNDLKIYLQETEKNSVGIKRTNNSQTINEIKDFAKNNFGKIDQDKDGYLSKEELKKAIRDQSIKGSDAAMIATLVENVGNIEEYSNDEWFDENDGITMKDLEKFVERAEKKYDDSVVTNVIDQLNKFTLKIQDTKQSLYTNNENPLASIRPDNITQGTIGDCFFISAVTSVAARNPREIKDMIRENSDGTFTVKFPGANREVIVEKPTDGEIALYATAKSDGLWLTILEKAYAQLRNDTAYGYSSPHDAIDGGDFQDSSIKLLTGHDVDTDFLPLTSKDTMREKLMKALKPDDGIKRIVTASTFMDGDNSKNIAPNHVFTILDYDPNTDKVKVRNPWGAGNDPTGTLFSDKNNDGTFELSIDELDEYFNLLAFEENKDITNYDHLGKRYLYKFGTDGADII